jgi:hypothetical protein
MPLPQVIVPLKSGNEALAYASGTTIIGLVVGALEPCRGSILTATALTLEVSTGTGEICTESPDELGRNSPAG